MQKLILKRKTGFKNNPAIPVIIRDNRYHLFYDTSLISKQVKKFNLPEGIYYVERGQFTQLKYPVKYKLAKLPIPERILPFPVDFKILFKTNPNKCTIDWIKRTITYDHQFMYKSLPEIFFVLYHEWGHARYKTERYADLFAMNVMLKRGFNPFQIGIAPIKALSTKNLKRKNYFISKLMSR